MRPSLLRVAAPLALLVAPASADVLDAGQVLRVEFTVNNAFNVQPNTMRLNFGLTQVLAAYGTRSAALYDGNTLLGTAMSSSFGGHVGALNLDPSNSFTAPGSPWTFDSPAVVDFTSILNGTIQGRIDFTIATGSMDIPLQQVNLNFVRATSSSGGTVASPPPTITSVVILGAVGASYCGPATPNSTGAPATLRASGSAVVAADDVELEASDLPQGSFGYFINARAQGLVANPGGSQGTLCLGGAIGRYVGAGQIFNSGTTGRGSLTLSLPNTPTPTGPVAIAAGETWYFQCWYRDANPSVTSNFTDGLAVLFQ